MQSKAATVEQYLAELPEERRQAISAVRKVVLDNLDRGFEEGMQYGMIGYVVPHKIYPAGYHCDPKQPLPFVCLASQKNYMSLYMICLYSDGPDEQRFRQEWEKAGKKLDMGKSCIRFKKFDDLAIDAIARSIRRVTVKKYIEHYEAVIKPPDKSTTATKADARKKTARATPSKTVSTKATVAKKSRKLQDD